MSQINQLDIERELVRRGNLEFLLNANQQEMYDIFKAAEDNSILVWLLGRQSGKSYGMALIASMEARSGSNKIIKLLTDTKLHCRTIFEPIFREIFDKFPKEMRPEYISSSYVYIFPNGSQIQMAGSDGNSAERLRGQKSDLVLVDEAGFCDNLNYNIMSVLLPTTTHTGGKIILASTPPEDPDHQFLEFIEAAEKDNKLTKKTIHDNKMLSKKQIENIISKFPGGESNPQFRREYLCEIIKNEERSVFPEATEELLAEITAVNIKPPFYDSYVSMDIGFKDLTVVLFGYYDFRADLIIIEDEIVKEGKNLKLPEFTEEINQKEIELWTSPITNEIIRPSVRVSDINYIVTQEIARASHNQISFIPARKEPGYKLPAINQVRVILQNRRILINPKCVTLRRHLKNCRWKDSSDRDEFARSPDHGHYDACDALIYFIRHMSLNKNPYPSHYQSNPANLHYPTNYTEKTVADTPQEIYSRIFGVKKKPR